MSKSWTRTLAVVAVWAAVADVGGVGQDLRQAILDGDLQAVQTVLQNRPAVNVPDKFGWTHLMNAAAYAKGSRADIVAALLDAGASLEAVNDQGDTALIAATRYARINGPVVRLLLARAPTQTQDVATAGRP